MRQFADCIQQSGLIVIDTVGDRFTWERNNIKEKIDWAFGNEEWNWLWPTAKVHHLSRYGSDHRPLFLNCKPEEVQQRRKTPFRCHAAWLLEEGFIEVVKNAWERGEWLDKVQTFVEEARIWNRNNIGNLSVKKQNLIRRIEGTDRARSRRDN
ncbi:uncharacterized protein LOC114759378 [Neltuma alba]|uniref:uncharacterized protein LOC114759378 n=1 Tax=Neltuma alba TaxID=207710 RepID=UPI0010A3DD90|nr:uncharacterized protein LOC114759378 [Prosopis alba]